MEAVRRAQPAVSKHLRVLREVGVVDVRRHGRHRVYALNAERLKPVHDWVSEFERFWEGHLGRVKERAEAKARDGFVVHHGDTESTEKKQDKGDRAAP